MVGDKRFTKTLIVEPDTILSELNKMDRQAWHKTTHDALYGMYGHTPDTEEAQYVIYTKCVEVIAHLLKPLLPPAKAIFLHLFPVVGGKFPVLAHSREVIGRCPGLGIHII